MTHFLSNLCMLLLLLDGIIYIHYNICTVLHVHVMCKGMHNIGMAQMTFQSLLSDVTKNEPIRNTTLLLEELCNVTALIASLL